MRPGRGARATAGALRLYGSAKRLGAWPPPNSFGNLGATKQFALAGSGGLLLISPPLGLQSKLGKIPCLTAW